MRRVTIAYTALAIFSGCGGTHVTRVSPTAETPHSADAFAAASSASSPTLPTLGTYEISPVTGPQGTTITIRGSHCDASSISVTFYGPRGDPAFAGVDAKVARDGSWTAHLVVRTNAATGHEYGVEAYCNGRDYTDYKYFRVLGSGVHLPATT